MPFARPIALKDRTLGADREPLTCAPLVGEDDETLRLEAAAVAALAPDLIEWRADFYRAIADTGRVLRAAAEIRQQAGRIPIIFTRRSSREGGQPVALGEDQVFALTDAVCRSGAVDLFDCELSSAPRHWQQARELAAATGVRMIGSFHDFRATPAKAELVAKFAAMQAAGADLAKVAVMPRDLRDVLVLLEATLEARERLELPLISMAMGAYGSVSRLVGWMYGSSVSFVVGERPSAPGQVPIGDFNAVVEVLERALGAR